MAALKRKKANEAELEKLQGTRFQLEMQVNTLESASFNAETMAAMKTASDALKTLHGQLCVCVGFAWYQCAPQRPRSTGAPVLFVTACVRAKLVSSSIFFWR